MAFLNLFNFHNIVVPSGTGLANCSNKAEEVFSPRIEALNLFASITYAYAY